MATVADMISGMTATLESATHHYSLVKDDKGLRETFHEAGRGLAVVGQALRAANTQLAGRNLTGDPQSTMNSLEACNSKAKLSESMFFNVAQAPEASRFERYKAAVKQEGQGRTVEVLVMGMMNDVRAVAENDAIRAAMDDWVTRLRDAMETLSKMEPSVPTGGAGNIFNSYGGKQFNVTGGTQNITDGSGPQFPGAIFHAPLTFGRNPS